MEINKNPPINDSPDAKALCVSSDKIAVTPARIIILSVKAKLPLKIPLTSNTVSSSFNTADFESMSVGGN